MPEQYAVARVTPVNRRHEGDPWVVRWPCEIPNFKVDLLAGPWDTLAEAQAVGGASIPKDWASIVDRDGRS